MQGTGRQKNSTHVEQEGGDDEGQPLNVADRRIVSAKTKALLFSEADPRDFIKVANNSQAVSPNDVI